MKIGVCNDVVKAPLFLDSFFLGLSNVLSSYENSELSLFIEKFGTKFTHMLLLTYNFIVQ